jgi:hypothetical protein
LARGWLPLRCMPLVPDWPPFSGRPELGVWPLPPDGLSPWDSDTCAS